MKTLHSIVSRAVAIFTFLNALAASPVFGQASTSLGIVEGRVLNATSGRFLNNARVTIAENRAEQFTDQFGQFSFQNVPAGRVTIKAFYTGLEPSEISVTIQAGQISRQDFPLNVFGGRDSAIVKLDAFVVATGRETDGSALAINEQRFAPNIKNVIATNESSEIPDGNINEFLKLIPGVAADSLAVRGFPPSMTTVTVDGDRVASAVQSAETRQVITDHLIINNVSRVEVTKVPTPDSPADSISGSINLVSKSAFEHDRPKFTYRSFFSWVDSEKESITFRKTPGPVTPSVKVLPGVDLTWIVPVNKRLGFTATATYVARAQPQGLVNTEWVPNSSVPSGYTATTADKPYLRQFQTRDGPRRIDRTSVAFTIDYKISPKDVLTFGTMYTYRSLKGEFQTVTTTPGPGVTSFSESFTQGGVGRGSVGISWTQNTTQGETFQPSLKYRHSGPIYKFDAAASYSHATDTIPYIEKTGTFNTGSVSLSNVTVRLDKIKDQRADITVTDTAGRPVDMFKLSNYLFTSAADNPRNSYDEIKSARANLGRDFDLVIPLSVKIGAEVRENIRDIQKRGARSFTFLGADGVAANADNNAMVIFNESFSTRTQPQFYPQPVQYASSSKAYDLFVAHPEYYKISNALTPWQNEVNGSKWINETISAVYARFDTHLLQNRLWLVGGVRYENTNDDGLGPLINPKLVPPGTTDPAVINKLTYVKRGTRVQTTYGDFYPSLNGTFNLAENTLFRGGYAKTISRPNFSNILPGATVPDPDSTSRTISLRNTALKPWQADNYDISIEQYFKQAGNLSIGAFRKDIADFFGAASVPVTPELLAPYGIDPNVFSAANGYIVSTTFNSGAARVSGIEINYRQNLTFLPEWAQGLQVFGSFTRNRLQGGTYADFSNFFLRTYTMGLNLRRRHFSISANMHSQGARRNLLFTGVGAPADTYEWTIDPQIYNVSGEFVITKHVSLFWSALNLGARAPWQARYNPASPDYSKLRNIGDTRSALYSTGIKGSF